MSTHVFSDPIKVQRLGTVLEAWLGTRFFPRMAQPGVGVDCVRFAFAVLQDPQLSVVGAIEWPRYSTKGGGAELIELIDQRVRAETCLRPIVELPFMAGDVLLAAAPLHLAIVGPGGEIWHALHPRGVQRGFLGEMHLGKIEHAYRAEVAA